MSTSSEADLGTYIGRIFINTVVLCELRDGRFARIRSAELRKINRP